MTNVLVETSHLILHLLYVFTEILSDSIREWKIICRIPGGGEGLGVFGASTMSSG